MRSVDRRNNMRQLVLLVYSMNEKLTFIFCVKRSVSHRQD